MGAIRGDWLVHGCLNVGDLPEDQRPALEIRDRIIDMYDGERFQLRAWPTHGFKNTLWWSEKNIPPRHAAAYLLRLDVSRGPIMYAGITVEKGLEDRDVARRRAQKSNEPIGQVLLGKTWDWHRALATLPKLGPALQDAWRAIGRELYCWVEFGGNPEDGRYFVVKSDALYARGGFKPIQWSKVSGFASEPHMRDFGRLIIVRAFGLNECTPEIDVSAVLDVFNAMRKVRDAWRGSAPVPRTKSEAG